MTRFEAKNVSEADVAAPRDAIWGFVTSPAALAQMIPLVERIDADGDRWCWKLKRISAFGVHVAPSFTEAMSFEPGRRMTFEHRPAPGATERAGAHGAYALDDLPDGRTHLSIEITLHIELRLPAISRRAVEAVMASMMARTGDKFAENLYARLGIGAGPVSRLDRGRR